MNRCGTVRGYFDHRKAGTETCPECRTVKRKYQSDRELLNGTCTQKGCQAPVKARELCGLHLGRLYRYGDPAFRPPSLSEQFWRKVEIGPVSICAPELGQCWLWTGNVGTKGYGKFSRRLWLAHRFAYTDMVGEIPDGLELDHLCRVLLCVNPDHLDPVTKTVNVRRQHAARRAMLR